MSPTASVNESDLSEDSALRDSTSGNSYLDDCNRWDHTYAKTEWPPKKDSTGGNSNLDDCNRWDHTYAKTEWPPEEVCIKQESELTKDSDCPMEAAECLKEYTECLNYRVQKQESSERRVCGVSEAAMLAGLYTDHVVKDELVLGPECVQHPPACGDSPGSCGSEAAMLVGLYTDHVVKEELVLGPECVQHPPACGDSAGSRGREAAMLAGLYTDHVVKEELVLGRECVQHPPACGHSAGSRGSEAAMLAGLHTDHADKDELVLGPERVQRLPVPSEQYSSNLPVTLRQELPKTLLSRELIEQDTVLANNTQINHEVTGSVDEFADLGHEVNRTFSNVVEQDTVFMNNTQIHHDAVPSSDEEAELKHEVDRNLTVVKETYVCDACNEEFAVKTQLMSHVTVHIQDQSESDFTDDGKIASNQVSAVETPVGPLVLTECLVRLDRIPHEVAFVPATTHPRAASHGATGSQLTHTDTQLRTYLCGICDKTFERKYELIQHIQLHTEENPAKKIGGHNKSGESCNTCGSFESHNKCKPYMCDICGKQFKQSCHLGRHKRTHMELYACNICKKEYTRLNNLRDHKWIHTGQKQYSCELCSKQFTQLRSLKIHKRIHTGETPYSCEICSKQFTRLMSLKVHEGVHTGETPYSCEICKKVFTRFDNIKRHMRTHTGELPYSCDICKKEFTRMSNLQEHIRIHSAHKSYTCEICKRRYTRLRTLKLHEKNFHMPDNS